MMFSGGTRRATAADGAVVSKGIKTRSLVN